MSVSPFIISVAPMMDCTDRHDRYFLRLMAPEVRLYTEMITTQALVHGDQKSLLAYHPSEKYIALQLGGSDPQQLVYCTELAENHGYNEVNLNVGCPSSRVKAGKFGACLMLQPELVAECVANMQAKVTIPVTVKCRIGVDDADSYEDLHYFISAMQQANCQTIIIHARKAWLNGLSPKENREIPPLQYETVYQIKRDFPHLTILINGGIKSLTDIKMHEHYVDGVMIGRAAYSDPYLLAAISNEYHRIQPPTREEVVSAYLPYVADQLHANVKLTMITRHINGLFHSQSGAARWRRYLSENAHQENAGVEVIEQALACINHSNN